MPFSSTPESSAEWIDSPSVPYSDLQVPLPEPNENYAYAAARLLSWFPVVNDNGATYFQEDIDGSLLDTLRGKQANLEHDKTRIVGTIKDYLITDEGIDIAVEIDRECAGLQDLALADLKSGNYFSHVSVELTRSLDDSYFYGIDDGFNVKQKIPVKTGLSMGMRRTTQSDPYKLQGNRVVERIKPARFTGVGFVPRPADTTATLYALAASAESEERELAAKMEHGLNVYAADHVDMSRDALTPGKKYADPGWQKDGKKRYPLDTHEHVASAAQFFGNPENRAKYSPEHMKEIDADIASAKKKLNIGDGPPHTPESASAEKETSMTEAEASAKIAEHVATIAALTAEKAAFTDVSTELASVKTELATAKTDLATVTTERDALKTEKVNKETAAALDAWVEELHGVHPFTDEAEKATARETAASYIDDAGRKQTVKTERELVAAKATIAKLTAAAAAAPAVVPEVKPVVTPEVKPVVDGKETAAFKPGEPPAVAVAPVFPGAKGSKRTYTSEELTEVF